MRKRMAIMFGIAAALSGCGGSSGTQSAAVDCNSADWASSRYCVKQGEVNVEALPPNSFAFSISGESLALGGYAFPPLLAGDSAFTDGWQVQFSKLLVTVDKIQLHANPDLSPSDQSQEGALVAELDGPWAVDLHQGGPLTGAGGVGANDGVEQAYPFEYLLNQNKNGGAAFDPSVTYAFGFSTVPSTSSAKFVNVDATDADYAYMIQNGCTVYYIGTATWNGGTPNANSMACTSSIPVYDFSSVPTTFNFKLCYATPTSYINCQNPGATGMGLGNEDHPRGVQTLDNQAQIAQLTIHTDHPLWESVLEDSPLHFDQFAANAAKQADGSYLATLADVKGKDWQAMTDASGNPLPWRDCLPASAYTPPMSTQMRFDGQGLTDNPTGNPASVLRDYYDFTSYVQSTQGHLNSNGLCYVSRNYPSPSGT